MERHGSPPPTRDSLVFIGTRNLDPWMHPATLSGKFVSSAPNWEQLSGGEQSHYSVSSEEIF